MMTRACCAAAPVDSEVELDLTAMARFLADIEIWLGAQDEVIRERFDWLVQVNTSLQETAIQALATDLQASSSAQAAA